ncbi:MAG: DUF4296 domain-containing protein [Bacteroidota bacterium]
MKKIIVPFLVGLLIFVSCEKEIAKAPEHLIEKDKMVDIMYDLAILGAMKSQNPVLLDSFKSTPNEYIYKKHKIDSTQFAQSNIYYAADFKQYKKMYERVKTRLEKNKKLTEAAIKSDKKKVDSLEKEKQKSVSQKEKDSIKNAKLKIAKLQDSIIKYRRRGVLGL